MKANGLPFVMNRIQSSSRVTNSDFYTEGSPSLCRIQPYSIHTTFSTMFNQTHIARSSSAIRFIVTDVLRGSCVVMFKSGQMYEYTNVSRRALLKLNLQPNLSLGFWVNDTLLYCDSKCNAYAKLAFAG